MSFEVLDYTKNPLTLIGKVASSCWNSKPSPRIALECIESGHGRVEEFADITVIADEYSARMIREFYTHVIGTSKLQESTRYVNCEDFKFYTPDKIKENNNAHHFYKKHMNDTSETYSTLLEFGIPKEDAANVLPIGMYSKFVFKINVRAIFHMAQLRLCTRAYKEFRQFMKEFLCKVSVLEDEWKQIISYAKPKCEVNLHCNEKHSCGRYPSKEVVERLVDEYRKGDKSCTLQGI